MMRELFRLKPRATFHSPINGRITLGVQKGEKAIFAGGVTQSGGELVTMWDTIIGNLAKQNHKVKSFLLLGVGAGMIFSVVKTYYPKATMIGIDIDPVMKQIAEKEFGWEDTPSQEIIITDVLEWLPKIKDNQFDLVAVDLFIGPLNTPKTRTVSFLKQVKRITKPKGVILYNAHYQEKNLQEYTLLQKQTNTLFKKVKEVFAYPLNRVLQLQT